jgi:hypothetical protein
MGRHYKNFETVVYIPSWVGISLTREQLEKDYDFLEKYIGLDKVYLESHRGACDLDREQLIMIKSFLESKGVMVSGGITTIIERTEGFEADRSRLFNTLCYTDPRVRDRLKEICEFAAGFFDEIILDDFYFTSCTCERCIKAKGDRDWAVFRRELMREVSKTLVVEPAKSVNPRVKMVIKYPNWRESYHFTGYGPEMQQDIFDATYIGTETRSPAYADQHLPEYLSYSLVRFLENAWPGRCGGGWFDTYQCWSIDRYLEQAYLTAFAGAKEIMHFQWSDLIDNPFSCALGLQLKKIDEMLSDTGEPYGIPVYIPHASCGENHLEMRLGMLGIPIEPTPVFPGNEKRILLTETSLGDWDIIDKLADFVRKGGDAIVTTGFLGGAGDMLNEAGLSECRLTGRKYGVTRYHITGDDAGYTDHCEPILFPEIMHGNNSSWSLLNGGDGDLHTSLLLRRSYGKGRLYVMAVPDNAADLYRLPEEVTDVYKRILTRSENDTYVSGRNISMFAYGDGSMILYRYVKDDLRPGHVTFHSRQRVNSLRDVTRGISVPVHEVRFAEDFEPVTEYVADVILESGSFRKFRWE